MKDKKPWYEKVSIWITIVVGICGILGISVFDNRSLFKGNKSDDTSIKFENNEMGDQSTVIMGDNNTINYNNVSDTISVQTESNNEEIYSSSISNNAQMPNKELESEEHNNSNNIGTPYVITDPNNTITKAYMYKWDEENDRDIIGNTYSSAIKLSVYNMIYAMGGGADNITAEIHFPIGNKLDDIIIMSFVVASEMVGNGSSAQITILADDNELFPVFTLDSTTTDELFYEIDLTGIRDLVIRFDCYAVDNGFCVGIVLEDK